MSVELRYAYIAKIIADCINNENRRLQEYKRKLKPDRKDLLYKSSDVQAKV